MTDTLPRMPDQPLSLADPWTVPTRHWHRLDDGRIQCDVCPRACRLHEGQRGLCFIRGRIEDQVVLASYGRSSGFCVDPIEKKPLNHFFPGTPVLSFGTAGCNLACKFCQNWDISKSREIDTLADAATPAGLATAAGALGCRSVAFTYNDPTIFLEYAIDVADACHERGLQAVAVTAGYIEPGARRDLYAHMDAANVDLKAFTENFYHRVCSGHLADVLNTLVYLRHETDVWFEITTLLIPGKNDSDAEIAAETAWIAAELGPDVPLHFTECCDALIQRPDVVRNDAPHAREHAIEVQLPFLLRVLPGGWRLVPVVVGQTEPLAVADLLEAAVTPRTLVVCSTDLSHYLDQNTAVQRDRRTAKAIVARRPEAIADHDACGAAALRGILTWAKQHRHNVELLDLRTSADTAGDRTRVVGYGAFSLLR